MFTWLSVTASYDTVIALWCTSQGTVVTFDVVLFTECDFTEEHDTNVLILAPCRANYTYMFTPTHRNTFVRTEHNLYTTTSDLQCSNYVMI